MVLKSHSQGFVLVIAVRKHESNYNILLATSYLGGGFFVLNNKNSSDEFWSLQGIVSSSLVKNGRCDISTHSIYIDVHKLRNWISSKMSV